MKLDYHMLDGREECVPEMKGWSSGHIHFTFGPWKLRVSGPSSWTFDELDEPYDREKWIALIKSKIIEDLTRGRTLDCALGNLFDQAKKHCDENHKDMREREARGEWTRKGH
jgi:hypothetical protein